MAKVFVGVGSNLGDRKYYIQQALAAMLSLGQTMRCSHVYRTAPYGMENQPNFLNMVVEIETSLSPEALLDALLSIETQLGRIRKEKWGPRTIDLDLLFYGEAVIRLPHLIVPHPEIEKREFVLRPLLDIAPDFLHPLLGKTIRDLYDSLIMSRSKVYPVQGRESS